MSWALLAAAAAGGLNLLGGPAGIGGVEPALRSAGCGFFYGLLAFHLQRVDPDDSHLQAGLVGAVCGIRSLAAPLPPLDPGVLTGSATLEALTTAMMDMFGVWLPLWLPLAGSALLLQSLQPLMPAPRP